MYLLLHALTCMVNISSHKMDSASLRSASTTLTGSSYSQSGVTGIKFSMNGSVASNGANLEEDTIGSLDDII